MVLSQKFIEFTIKYNALSCKNEWKLCYDKIHLWLIYYRNPLDSDFTAKMQTILPLECIAYYLLLKCTRNDCSIKGFGDNFTLKRRCKYGH